MPIDLIALRAEIEGDPAKLGYAPLLARGSDADIAEILNSQTGPGVGQISLASMPSSDLVMALLPAVVALSTKSNAIQAKWDRLLGIVRSYATVHLNASVKQLLGGLVADGLMTAEDLVSIGKRSGSRAEVLFGDNVVVHHLHVAAAFGRGNGP